MYKQVLFTFLVLAFSNNMLFSNEDSLDGFDLAEFEPR